MNQAAKMLECVLLTLIQGHMRMLRTPGPSEGFGTEDEVFCLEYCESIKSLLRKTALTVLLLLLLKQICL
jgi:hypothetical protein